MKKPVSQNGFTLVEVLVAVGITVAVFSTILIVLSNSLRSIDSGNFKVEARNSADAALDYMSEKIEEAESTRRPLGSIEVGARAYVKPLDRDGMVLAEPDDRGRVEVVVGALRVEVEAGDLFEPSSAPPKPAAGAVEFEAKEVPGEIEVRGMTAEDAWETVDKYLDDAALQGHPSVRIIHGKGRGILAKKIREMLASHPRVKAFRFGELAEGGTGVTVIEFDRG